MTDRRDGSPGLPRPPRRTYVVSILWTLLILFLVARSFDFVREPSPRTVTYSEFVGSIDRGEIAEVRITDHDLTAQLKNGKGSITTTRLPGVEDTRLLARLDAAGVKYSGKFETRLFWLDVILTFVLPFALIGVLLYSGLRRLRKTPALRFGKTNAKVYDSSGAEKVTFNDVAGVDEAEAELIEIVDFLKNPGRYGRLGGRMPKGVLLVGPPGTGKTLLAKAVAGESGVPFFSISGAEFVEMFVGVGAARVRDLFEQAKENAPCIIFIDELDAVGRSRMAGRGMLLANDEREQTLNQLLAEMDGFDSSKGVIIMAATNAPEVLDPALLRAGRFDRQVVVDRPDVSGREAILAVHARGKKIGDDVRLATIAARTAGMAGADLANIVNEAALLAARRNADMIAMRDFEEAIDRVTLGLQRRSRVMTPREKERVAYHETGHALVAFSLPHADPVHRISIVPRSVGALGHTLQLPTEQRFLMTRPELEEQIAVLMGGRAAEELAFDGVVSTGAADDFEKATTLVRMMVTRFGMSEAAGPMTWEMPLGGRYLDPSLFPAAKDHSEATARRIDAECRSLVDAAHARAASILSERRNDLDAIAKELIERETLTREDLDSLLSRQAIAAV